MRYLIAIVTISLAILGFIALYISKSRLSEARRNFPEMKLHSHHLASVLTFFIFLTSPAIAIAKGACVSRGDSTADKGHFLECEYRTIEATLKAKVDRLITFVSSSKLSSVSKEVEARDRADVISGIQQAYKHWRLMTEIECRTLVGIQYTGGSAQENYTLQCLIDRTTQRIKFIEDDDAYKAYWTLDTKPST